VRPENLLLLALLAGLLFLMFSRTRKQQREAQQIQAGLTVGVEVMTTAGLYATVVAIEDQVVTLETSPGQTSRWDRRAVSRVLTPATAVDDEDDEDGLDEDEEFDGDHTTDEGAGARLEHGTVDGGATGSSPGPDTAPPDRA
jgi:preprotein translocase subunit YajC